MLTDGERQQQGVRGSWHLEGNRERRRRAHITMMGCDTPGVQLDEPESLAPNHTSLTKKH